MPRKLHPLFVLLCVLGGASAFEAVAAVPAAPMQAADVKPLKVGDAAPAFTVRTALDEPFNFDPKALHKPTAVIFYRGGWCPYCNAHLGELRAAEPQLLSMGYDVLFMSTDRPALLRPSLKEKDINYTLLSDAQMHAARAFGVAFRVDDATVKRYKTVNIDLEAASGETHHELPVPAVFIIDRKGEIRFTHWDADYKVRMKGAEIVEAARKALDKT